MPGGEAAQEIGIPVHPPGSKVIANFGPRSSSTATLTFGVFKWLLAPPDTDAGPGIRGPGFDNKRAQTTVRIAPPDAALQNSAAGK